jgi:enoyl reductase-like protein
VSRDLKADLHDIDKAQQKSWWKRLIEGDAQAVAEHYGKLASNMNDFIVSVFFGFISRLSQPFVHSI